MTDKELRAHDLAVAVAQNLHPDLHSQLASSTLEFLCHTILEDYESAYEYFKANLQ